MMDSCHVFYGLPGQVQTSPVRRSTRIRVEFRYRHRGTTVSAMAHIRGSTFARGDEWKPAGWVNKIPRRRSIEIRTMDCVFLFRFVVNNKTFIYMFSTTSEVTPDHWPAGPPVWIVRSCNGPFLEGCTEDKHLKV